ncbi:hypothetical protein Tco_0139950 [Tanacetum coccineum]
MSNSLQSAASVADLHTVTHIHTYGQRFTLSSGEENRLEEKHGVDADSVSHLFFVCILHVEIHYFSMDHFLIQRCLNRYTHYAVSGDGLVDMVRMRWVGVDRDRRCVPVHEGDLWMRECIVLGVVGVWEDFEGWSYSRRIWNLMVDVFVIWLRDGECLMWFLKVNSEIIVMLSFNVGVD